MDILSSRCGDVDEDARISQSHSCAGEDTSKTSSVLESIDCCPENAVSFPRYVFRIVLVVFAWLLADHRRVGYQKDVEGLRY